MFQFPGFALKTLCIQVISTWLTRLLIPEGNNNRISGGFPHSEISGSKPIPGSPKLIAGYRVLHRLLLPRHPPNALIALDLTRKKKDPASLRSLLVPSAGPARLLRSKACIYSRLPRGEDLVSVLDLDNAAVGLQSEDWPPLAPHSGPADNADYLSERCKAIRRSQTSDWTGKRDRRFPVKSGQMVEPDGVEPTTSCLQSRRSTN